LEPSECSGGAGDGGSFHDDRSSHGYGTGHLGGAGPASIQDNVAVSAMESRQAREISGRFKDRAAKFMGKTDLLLNHYKTKYDLVTRYFGVSAHQKMVLLHNLLDGEALRLYLDEVMRTTVSYETARANIEGRFLIAVHQGRAENYLQNLPMSDFIKADVSEADALEKVFTIIARVAKVLTREFYGAAHRAHFLRGAVIGYPWAMQPLSRQHVQPVTFQELYEELHASLSFKTDAEAAVARDRASSAADTAVEAVTSVYFGGQGRYAVADTGSATRLSARPADEYRAAGPPPRGGC